MLKSLYSDWGQQRCLKHILLEPFTIASFHEDLPKWKHFQRYWPSKRGIDRSPVYSPHKGQRRGALVFSMMCTWAGGWVNIRDVCALRRHRAHYDVAVMHLHVLDMNIAQILSSNMAIPEFNFRIDHLN